MMEYQNYQQNHHAIDGLMNLLTKANHDLTMIQFTLEKEFHQIYPDNANPMKLVSRIKKIQEDLPILKEQCQELLAAKQDLIDKASTILVENRNLVQRMQAVLDIPVTNESKDPAFANFKQIIDEWTAQVTLRTDEKDDSSPDDINNLLFSAIVQGN